MPAACSGAGGAGTVDHFGLHGRVDIQVGTLSKAIGVIGGFIAGPAHLIEWLQNRGGPYLFSTSAPPPVVAACIAALDVIARRARPARRASGRTPSCSRSGLHELGFDTGASETPITPVITGDEVRTQAFARAPVRGGCVLPRDRVPDGGQGTRRACVTIVTADHTEDDLREALEVFETGRVGARIAVSECQAGPPTRAWMPASIRSSPNSNCSSGSHSAR